MTSRAYSSPLRIAAAAEKRQRVLTAATELLREQDIARFSLDSVAKAAGVTRLTVYNQFGSRRGLLEAAFDEIARAGGLTRLRQVITIEDPQEAVNALIDVFCDFWSSDKAIGRFFDAVALDPEFGEAVLARNELRRGVLSQLVARMQLDAATPAAKREVVDLMFALTSYPFYRILANNRSIKATKHIIRRCCADAIKGLGKAGL